MNNPNQIKHQFGFSFMRTDTGGQRVHAFWGTGVDVDSCKKDALVSAKDYAVRYENELNEKARRKSQMRGERFAPSHINVQIVGSSLWR